MASRRAPRPVSGRPNERTFVDTNILVYAYNRSEEGRLPVAQAVLDEIWKSRTGAISTQVLQEFYVVATRKFDPPMTPRAARAAISAYSVWLIVQVDLAMILAASYLVERHSLSFWDALIIEAAHRAGASRVLSEDLQTGRRIGDVIIENPFAP
jgi:predicted nucleic acid-binding protein